MNKIYMSDNNIDEFIKNLLEEDPSLQDEIKLLLNNTAKNYEVCSYKLNNFIITPTISGLSFLANYNFLTIINMLIPDLFLECSTKKYESDVERFIYLPQSCPIYTYTTTGPNKYGKLIDSLNIDTYYQKIIDVELIQAFFYFNFTSDFTQNESQYTRLVILNERVHAYLLNKPPNNSSKFTDPQAIFAELYSSNSLLIQIINFSNTLNEVLGLNKNGTNICQYYIPWLFTYNCLGNAENELIPYNSFNSNESLYALEYADLFYLSNVRTNINSLLEAVYKYTLDLELINILMKSNIFTIIDIALSVYNNILMEISYILSNKVYVKHPYQNIINVFKCLNLYYNYASNEIFLNEQANLNSNINIDKNILINLEKIIASFNIK